MWDIGDPNNKRTAAEILEHNRKIQASIEYTMKNMRKLKEEPVLIVQGVDAEIYLAEQAKAKKLKAEKRRKKRERRMKRDEEAAAKAKKSENGAAGLEQGVSGSVGEEEKTKYSIISSSDKAKMEDEKSEEDEPADANETIKSGMKSVDSSWSYEKSTASTKPEFNKHYDPNDSDA